MNIREEVSKFAPEDTQRTGQHGELERWEIDPTASRLGFTLRHLVVQQIRGQFRRWGGTLFLDRSEPALSSLDVWVDVESIDTESLERDAHLRSAEFLEVARFPRADFKSSAIEPREGRLIVSGRLQLHGVTRDLELDIELATNRESSGRSYVVRGKLDRQQFGLHWNQDLDVGGIVVGDEIALSAEVRLLRVDDRSAIQSKSGHR